MNQNSAVPLLYYLDLKCFLFFCKKLKCFLKLKNRYIQNKPTSQSKTKMSSTRTSTSSRSTNSTNSSRSSKPTKSVKAFCKVCYDAGKSEDVYTSHFVKDAPGKEGKVVCPYLLSLSCGYCRKDRAGHTTRHCPELSKKDSLAAAREPAAARVPAPAVAVEKKKKQRPGPLVLNLNIAKYEALAVIIQAEEEEDQKHQAKKTKFISNFPILSKDADRYQQILASPTTPTNYNEIPPSFNAWWSAALNKPAAVKEKVEAKPPAVVEIVDEAVVVPVETSFKPQIYSSWSECE